ncbi:MAG: MarR family transcriptional regulator, partial [Clostridia bacterium]|nr:MarR family transcriptional regulator [Clostridia bacterium]
AYKGKLMILKVLYCSKQENTAGDLAKVLNVSTARIATAINSLESKGFVVRNHSVNDGRKVIIAITESGKQALQDYNNQIKRTIQGLFGKLTDEELDTFINLSKKLFS